MTLMSDLGFPSAFKPPRVSEVGQLMQPVPDMPNREDNQVLQK